MRFRVVALLLLTVFPACSRTVHIPAPAGNPVTVVVWHHNAGAGVEEPKEILLQPYTPEYQRLQDWITHNQKGWYPSFAPTGSGGIYIHCGDLHMQFDGQTVSVFTGKGHFHKDVREDDYAFLKLAVGR